MIDIESEVFSAVAAALRAQFPGIYVSGEYPGESASFPCDSLEEIDNTVDKATQDSGNVENHANLSYENNAYSNKTVGRKAEAKAIAAAVDTVMSGIGFTRILMQPTPNTANSTAYRITSRYTAVADKSKTIYRG